jgi:quercetin dioxygenase-like cupin family protein
MTPHKHELPHTVVVYEGELLAKTWCETGCGEEKEKVFKTGDSFLIDAHWMHVFSALTDVAKGVCIFPARDPELKGSVIDYSGW